MIAIYNGEQFECGIDGEKIILYSNNQQDGFERSIARYKKVVNRKDCERVYRQENRFLYKGKSFRYRDESDGKILLIDNSKNNGFELRLDYDEYGKWVNISDGEKNIKINCHKRLYTSEDFADRSIQFDKRSLPELIKVLEQGDCINLLKSFIVTTSWDQIEIDSLGDERSADGFCLELYNRRKIVTNVDSDRFGPVTIPLGQKPEETGWEYIRPLIEDLKKYC